MSTAFLRSLRSSRNAGQPMGVTSVCSAHPMVLEAALAEARDAGGPVLIEATCNQVNQFGGYTGMVPADFRNKVLNIADTVGMPSDRVMLGGDHLGPNPWTALPSEEAMQRAEEMVRAYVDAGFRKIHLDCSMPCLGDPARLPDDVISARAARLCRAAEDAAGVARSELCYVVGTEVPAPGGVADVAGHVSVTTPQGVEETMRLHTEAFARAGVASAIERVIAIVVQPGVEFGASGICHYDREAAMGLPTVLAEFPHLVFEAHSTDYQRPQALRALVEDGFAILKVGPWLTFALREALYGLAAIRTASADGRSSLMATMETLMLADPRHWQAHYSGSPQQLRSARHFSYSDRIRYYWDLQEARMAVGEMMDDDRAVEPSLVSQYLPRLYEAVRDGQIHPSYRSLALAHVQLVLRQYRHAAVSQSTDRR